ncbi:non-ribosomal peptide synthetase [Clostridium sp. FP1]|uniref:non-ribosomal peptide synthetase n=1 Tax=Clostridium sp. FP1 TaxID=2724076 RepID=UPI0013E9011B|nr:non-ribosomal peptide synthetase [Clostridium sp. FP1]MBZ9636379.1 amino acid adenylation domain-containing protein [Clostridium sp. FP1]
MNKIRKDNIEDIMDLTDTQKGMLYHYIKDSETKEYQEQTCITITGEIDIEILKKTWNYIIETNEMLRTVYKWDKLDKPVQIVLKNYDIPFKFFDLSKESNEARDKLFKEILENHKNENINITNESIKITICKIEEHKCKMIIKNHHILYDGWSNGIILKEFIEAYNCYFQGEEPIKQVKNKFKELVKWNKEQDKNRQKEYWQKYLKGFEHESNMFSSNNTSKMHKYIGEYIYTISDLTKNRIEASAKKLQVSVAAILYSAWSILQQRYENSEDIIFGMTVSGRTAKIKGIDNIVGMFINTIPLRVKTHSNQEVSTFIKSVEESLRAHEEFENTSLLDIKSYAMYNHEKSVFDNIVVIENYPLDKVGDKNSKIKIEDCFISETTNFNLTFGIGIFDDLEIKVSYNKESFEDEFIIAMTVHFENILNEIVSSVAISISEIKIISEEEKNRILYDFNDTYAEYPRDKTIHELFEEQVEKTPDNVAVVFEDKELTYRELNERANRLARTLRGKGVKPDSIVGIMVDRSIEMIVGMLGILKSGGAYLPIGSEYPEDRVTYMLEDSKTNIILTQSRFKENVVFNGETLDLECERTYAANGENIKNVSTARELAYVIYTSGSTGKPKGVMVEHRNVVNILTWFVGKYNISHQKHIVNLIEYTFDPSVEQIFGTLISGAKLYIPKKEEILDKNKFAEYVINNKINVISFVPAMIKELLIDNIRFNTVDTIIIGGERLEDSVKNKLMKMGYNVFNHYGPTETTIDALTAVCKESEKVTLGRPIQNTEVYIIDKENNIVPIGVCGELCISGEGLARGYLNMPEFTLEKFIESPFALEKKMYKTGDLARWLPDGNIEFHGRIDHQVKIRGFRIELGEIESQLINYEDIKESIVIDREDENGTKYLCAYLVSGKELTVGKLRSYLSQNLPEYMIPSYFVQLEKMPLTPNGKIDRKALPKLDGSIVRGTEYEAPRNEVEEKLVAIWKDVLAAEKVGINDNFFELGGHSLKATTLVSRIHRGLNVEVPIREIFKSPTIKGTSEYIESTERSIYSSIEIVEEKEYYEASSSQKRMYLLQQFDLKSTGYNMPGVMMVEGRLNVERLEKSFAELIIRHETLRTSFETIEGKIVQRVNECVNFKLDCFDVDCIEGTDKEIDNIVSDFVKAFELNKSPLLRVGLIKLKEDKHILMFDMHHIISDGVSMGILTNEFARIYEGDKLEQLRIQYKDYSQWQNRLLKSEVMQEQKEYWINRFSDKIPVLNMPTDFQRPLMQNFEGDSINFKLDKELTKEIKRISKETGSTIYMVLLSGVNILLSKYSGQEDIIVGSPIAGRPHADLEKIIGMFVNTIAMRNYPEGSRTYEDFLKQVKENALKAYENQDYQFNELVDKLSIPRDISRNPLFDVMFTMQNMDSEDIELKDLVFKEYKQEHKVAKFDLTFSASEVEDEITFELEYSEKLYKRETIERMVEHFVNILKVITRKIYIKLSEIEMLTEGEKQKLLHEFNDTYAEYPRDKTIHELFEEQVKKTPDNIAVVFEGKGLTYRELNEKVNKLARNLRERGVKPDSIVGIMVERSTYMIVGIMAVLKAGGAYLPIDPEYPEERIKYMLENSNVEILLIQSKLKEKTTFKGELLDLEDEKYYGGIGQNLDVVNSSRDLAYVIYTSGSTGKPKGVMIEQLGVVNLSYWYGDRYNLKENLNMLQSTNISFDASIEETIVVLLNGATMYILPKYDIIDKHKFLQYVTEKNINIVQLVPATLKELIVENDYMKSLSIIICGGEKLNENVKNKVIEKGYNLYDHYGPTETTVVSITTKCNIYESTIGTPLQNNQIAIINKNKNLQPIGVPGELCISGDGLARGYLDRPELTVEKFIDNPFVSGEKMYKTGDLARWMPDGNIEFLGRIDYQVKIRGFRIELGEIENQLLNHEAIKEIIVLDREDENGAKYLCAYLVSEKELTVGELRAYLSKKLPGYMIPSYFVQLDKMPLTPNGKLDRKALPRPDGSIVTGAEFEAPRNEVEEKLATIWKHVLGIGIGRVGINDNFFELGGHSLKATILVSKIHKELNVEVPLREIFKSPTIKGISEYIESTEKSIYSSIEIVKEKEYYEASSAQKRMYMLQQFDLKSTGYNMPGVMQVEGRLNVERLEKSFIELIIRHETLRTSFETIEDKIVQRVNESVNFKLNCVEVGRIENQEKAIDSIVKDFVKAFDLNKAPLLRVGLIKLEADKHILMFDIHHIISDGVSMGILTNEFSKIYEGNKLKKLRIQYKDYSQWQNSLLKSAAMQEQKEYWINRFKGEIPVLNMPADFQRPLMQSFEGENISFKLDKELTKELKKISKETGSTMYMVLLSGVNILLSKYSGQEDIIVGSPIAGRPRADLEKIIGMFVNTLAMRNYPEGSRTYEDFLKEVMQNALKAYENQDYQFDELIDKLSIPRDISRNPLFDVMFTMQNMDSVDIELKDLILKGYKQEHKVAKFDLTFSASEVGDEIIFELEYSKKLYKRETIERMVKHFVNIIKAVVIDTKIKLSEIDMLTEGEKHKLLYEFNDTYADYPRDKTIHELFEEQVEKTPDNIAIVFEDKQLTYRELNDRANGLARNLRGKRVKPDSIVAIMTERSVEMIVGIMGILKSGGAYLPIDNEYPEDRIKYILDDSKTNILLTQNNLVQKVAFQGEIIDLIDEKSYVHDQTNLRNINMPKDLAYIIYTSGTTGRPKGAMIEHRNVVRLMFNEKMKFDFSDKDVWTMFHSYCFDFSVWEMYGALLYGGKLVLISRNTARDTEEYLKTLKQERVTILNQIPTPFYNLMNKELNYNTEDLKLRYVIFGGEPLKPEMLSEWMKKYSETKLINMYGITETTVHVTYKEIGKKEINQKISNIGNPIPTLSTYIMDKNLKLQPIGVAGELCVGGEGVGRGYLNNKELTEQKFVFNAYKPEEKIYRSGDLARVLVNGELEYLGRIDHQVKIRGFRIELGEIESQLLNYEEIKEIIVIDREDESGAKYLCAYLVAEKELTVGELREHLLKTLPEYMVPSYFVQLDKMPLTPNGKIDRKALPELDGKIITGAEYEAARNEIEEKLVTIWKDVLAVERVGINDNFFELGGHSLKATTLVSKIHKELNVEVPLREIFKFPTIKGMSKYIESTEKSIYSSIEIVEDKEYYEASSAQKRMYMLQQFELDSTGYNIPGVMWVEGRFEAGRLVKAFIELIRRHETLRTSFEIIEDKIVQRINESVNLKLDHFEVDCNENQEKAVDNIVRDFVKAFDLNKAPLLRVGLIKLKEEKHILMFDMHHIISDGVSMGILINEFAKIYEGNKLEQLRIQYKDYSEWQNKLLKSKGMKKQEEYWINRFSGKIPTLNMPIDYARPIIQRYEGSIISFKLDRMVTGELNRIAKEIDGTMYMVILSCVNILLTKYSEQEDIVIGTPIAGRRHADLQKIIGVFVNTLLMRNYPKGNKTFRNFLKEVKENALEAYENQDYQFEELVDKLKIPRDRNRNLLFDVMFVMQNMDLQKIELKDLTFRNYDIDHKIAKFDLKFIASEVGEEIIFSIEYSTDLFERGTIDKMIRYFKNIITTVISDKNIKLNKILLLNEIEVNTISEKVKRIKEDSKHDIEFDF